MNLVPNPQLDLTFERVAPVPRHLVWKAWTEPEQLMKWFTPAPWRTVECEIDLRPGGVFRTVMLGPNGEQPDAGEGCYLEVVENERLVWTSAMGRGYRPRAYVGASYEDCEDFAMTAVISLEDHPEGTKYTVLVIHADERSRKAHEDMGFYHGWSAAFDQLVALIQNGNIA